MAIQQVEEQHDKGNERAVALLPVMREPCIRECLSAADQKRLEELGGKYHFELTQADAVWMAQAIAAVVGATPARTRSVLRDDGVNPAAR